MMRPISLLCMLLAIGSGLYLYRVKYHAQLLDREINLTLRGADDARARASVPIVPPIEAADELEDDFLLLHGDPCATQVL